MTVMGATYFFPIGFKLCSIVGDSCLVLEARETAGEVIGSSREATTIVC